MAVYAGLMALHANSTALRADYTALRADYSALRADYAALRADYAALHADISTSTKEGTFTADAAGLLELDDRKTPHFVLRMAPSTTPLRLFRHHFLFLSGITCCSTLCPQLKRTRELICSAFDLSFVKSVLPAHLGSRKATLTHKQPTKNFTFLMVSFHKQFEFGSDFWPSLPFSHFSFLADLSLSGERTILVEFARAELITLFCFLFIPVNCK